MALATDFNLTLAINGTSHNQGFLSNNLKGVFTVDTKFCTAFPTTARDVHGLHFLLSSQQPSEISKGEPHPHLQMRTGKLRAGQAPANCRAPGWRRVGVVRIPVSQQDTVGQTSCLGKDVLFEDLLVSHKYAI